MTEKSIETMEYIWEKLPKNKDGYTITYQPGDLGYLYFNGFVDTPRYSFQDWQKAFEPFRQKEGSFKLNKEQFLSLRQYRFDGPIHELFEVERLREGPWPDSELEFLYEKSISISSTISKEVFLRSITALKKQGYVDKKGNLIINDAVRKQFHYLLEKFESPRRRLEKEAKRLREEKDELKQASQKNRDASSFAIGKSQTEFEAERLKELETAEDQNEPKKAPAQEKISKDPTQEKKEEIDIKNLKKPTGKFRG